MNLYRKRKFVIAFTALAMTFVLGLTGVVDGSNWVASVGLIVGLYGMANAMVHRAKNGGKEHED